MKLTGAEYWRSFTISDFTTRARRGRVYSKPEEITPEISQNKPFPAKTGRKEITP